MKEEKGMSGAATQRAELHKRIWAIADKVRGTQKEKRVAIGKVASHCRNFYRNIRKGYGL